MKKVLLSLILLLSIECFSQSDGYQIFKYPNGVVSSEGTMRDGKPDGFWKSYYVTGVMKSEGKRSNFKLDSIWVFYDQQGDTLEKINYLYGEKNGYYYKYGKDPTQGTYIKSRELYVGDKQEGTAYIYFPKGNVKQTIPYNSGKKEGVSIEYDNSGNIVSIYEYNNDFLVNRERINRVDAKGLKQGSWKEYYPSGQVKIEQSYKDNLLHGYYKEYDNRGKLTVTLLYDNGSLVEATNDNTSTIQIVNKYNEGNKLIYSGPYRDDVPVGIHREYNEDGSIKRGLVYNDNGLLLSEGLIDASGNRNGAWKDLYPGGTTKAEGMYNNNLQTGSWKFYSIEGNVEQVGTFNNGRPDGTWKWYYQNNSLRREEEYYRGLRDGLYTEYNELGDIIVQGEYADGEKNKMWKYLSGDYSEEGNYIVGLKDGVWKAYYSDGTLKYKGNYIQGNPDGLHTYYYESGKVKEEQYYKMGIKQRIWRKYSEEGAEILSITYRDDKEISINGVKINLPDSDVKLIK